jgi:flagellar biosynthesis protein FlhA
LLRERIPVRDLATILEAITDAGSLTRDVNVLTEAARASLARTISSRFCNEQGELAVLMLDPRLEQLFAERMGLTGGAQNVVMEPEFGRSILEKIEAAIQAAVLAQPVVLCSASIRPHLRRLTERFLPELAVIAHAEVAPGARLITLGTIN